MIRTLAIVGALAFTAAAAPLAAAQQTQSAPAAAPILDGPALIGPPPAAGSAGQAADTLAMHARVSPERLAQARADQAFNPWLMMQPVLGADFTDAHLPRTKRVYDAMLAALVPPVDAGKARYTRARPYALDANVLQCDQPSGGVGGISPSYPSTHAALGWAWGLLMAEMLPARADAVLQRGRDFGDSRNICGFHFPTDLEASRLLAAAVVARLHGDAHFRADLDQARRELARAYPAQAPRAP